MKAIIATDKNFGIGFKGGLPWVNKEDLRHFKNATSGGIMFCGFKTFKSMHGVNLENRSLYVLSTKERDFGKPFFTFNKKISVLEYCCYSLEDWGKKTIKEAHNNFLSKISVENFLSSHASSQKKNIWLIGGKETYEQLSSLVNEVHWSIIEGDYECDTFMNPEEVFNKKNVKIIKYNFKEQK